MGAIYSAQRASGNAIYDAQQGSGGGATVPDAPIIGTALAGNTSAYIYFTPPGNDGGSTILSYKAYAYKVSDDTLVTSVVGDGAPILVTGLTNGVAVYMKTTATNAIGESTQSSASNAVTPAVPSTTNPPFKRGRHRPRLRIY